ncbi:MAG: GNAT family N-acetyltransferase [Prolixibacteraceae bacterium]|nr:GNAT family N-acetyltransferase [Prolixibacteraceae bacterium]MBN2649673.1 GNAT family N-acetyltransferase [Prolixibacteraceae bacterium]
MMDFEILEWDSSFFGYPVATIINMQSKWVDVLDVLKKNGVYLAYWQVKPGCDKFSTFAKNNNGLFVDKKTTYSNSILNYELSMPEHVEIYEEESTNSELLDFSVQCGMYSRFKVDQNINNEKFEGLYRLWMETSVAKRMADDVLVYRLNNRIVGVVTVYVKAATGYIGLIGVDEQFRGRGIGKGLIKAAKTYFGKKRIKQIDVITQGLNISACTLYEHADFSIKEQADFYHFWLTR